MTVGDLRKKIENIPDDVVICADGAYGHELPDNLDEYFFVDETVTRDFYGWREEYLYTYPKVYFYIPSCNINRPD